MRRVAQLTSGLVVAFLLQRTGVTHVEDVAGSALISDAGKNFRTRPRCPKRSSDKIYVGLTGRYNETNLYYYNIETCLCDTRCRGGRGLTRSTQK